MFFEKTSIIEVNRFEYKEEICNKNHCRNFFHLIYIVEGKGVLRIQEREFEVIENDLYLIQPNMIYEIYSNCVHSLFTLEVKFMTDDQELKDNFNLLPFPYNSDSVNIKNMLNFLVDEKHKKNRFHKEMITLHSLEMLLQIIRSDYSSCIPREKSKSEYTMSKGVNSHELADDILKYLHCHYTEQITLTELAEVFNITFNYVGRIFTKKYKISPMQYVNNLRLKKVKELLSDTDRSITEISEMVGFNSIHYFSRYFTSKEKITPQEYRKRVKKSNKVIHNELGTG